MLNEVIDILVKQSIQPQVLSPNIIKFSRENLNYVFQADLEDDPNYFRLLLPDVEPNMEDMQTVYEKIAKITSSYKVGKCIIVNGKVWMSAEGFCYDTAMLPTLMKRLFIILQDMFGGYNSYGREQNGTTQN